MKVTKKQIEILRYDKKYSPRITILEGAVRSGKTFINVLLFLTHVARYRNHGYRYIITGTTIPSIRRNVLDLFKEIPSVMDLEISFNINNEFELFGNKVSCFGCSNVDDFRRMKGFTAHGWLGNEVTEQHVNSIDQAFKRCSAPGSRIFWDTNPSGPTHLIKERYIDRSGETLVDGTMYIKSWHFLLDDNTFLDPNYIDSIKRSTPSGMWYDRDILGLWVAAEGMIYRDFDLGLHVVDVIPGRETFKEFIAGVDWGFEHKGVIGLYGIDHDGNVVRILEIAEPQKTIDWWVGQARELVNTFGWIEFYADPARPDNISAFRKGGLVVREAENAVVEGITCVAEQFRRKRLYIVKQTNKNYLSEIYNYRWKPNMAKEEPIKEGDHSMDSERYAIYSHFGKRHEIVAAQSLYR